MGLLDALFGKKKLPRSRSDRLGNISTSELAICTKLSVRMAGVAGLAIKPVAMSQFDRARDDLSKLLEYAGRDLGAQTSIVPDGFGYLWVVVRDDDFTDLVATAQIASETITEEGFRDQLLCAVFAFVDAAGPLHFVYAFKRGSFYAFAPRSGQQRDVSLELRAHSLLERELPLEKDMGYRYPLWGMPFD